MELKKLYNIHRFIMLIAFLILLPIGIGYAFYKQKWSENWYSIHKSIMGSVAFLSVIGIFISLYTKDTEGNKNMNKYSTIHGTIGLILVCFLLFQLYWAIVVRRVIERPNWLLGHRINASIIVMLVLYNLYLGYTIYIDRFVNPKMNL